MGKAFWILQSFQESEEAVLNPLFMNPLFVSRESQIEKYRDKSPEQRPANNKKEQNYEKSTRDKILS